MDFSFYPNSMPQYSFTPPQHDNSIQQDDFDDLHQYYGYDLTQVPQNISIPQQLYTPPDLSAESTSMRQWETSGSPELAPSNQDGQQEEERSSSDERGPSTPAVTKRKAQNRAAQRAFRERKEKHVKDLEIKVQQLAAHSTSLASDNERLKRELDKLATQNEILRATSQPAVPSRPPSSDQDLSTFTPVYFLAKVGIDPTSKIRYEDFGGEPGNRLLSAGKAWQFIQETEKFKKGQLDIAEVCEILKRHLECDGRGPAVREGLILKAIEESSIMEDELL